MSFSSIPQRLLGIQSARDRDQALREVAVDTPVARCIGIRECVACDIAAQTHVVELGSLGSQTDFDVAQALAIGQLREGHAQVLIEAREALDLGIAYQLETHLPQGRSPLLWKTLFLSIGFVAAYGVAVPHWSLLAMAGVVLLLLTAVFFLPRSDSEKSSAAVEKLERDMKKCC